MYLNPTDLGNLAEWNFGNETDWGNLRHSSAFHSTKKSV